MNSNIYLSYTRITRVEAVYGFFYNPLHGLLNGNCPNTGYTCKPWVAIEVIS